MILCISYIYIYISHIYIYIIYIYIYIYMKSELGSPTAMMQTFASKGMRSWRLSCRTCRKRRCGCGKHWTTSGPSWHVWWLDGIGKPILWLYKCGQCINGSVAQSVLGMKSGQWGIGTALPAPTHPSVFWNLPGNPGSQVLQIPVAGPKSFAAAGCYVCSSDQGLHIYELLRIYVCVCNI